MHVSHQGLNAVAMLDMIVVVMYQILSMFRFENPGHYHEFYHLQDTTVFYLYKFQGYVLKMHLNINKFFDLHNFSPKLYIVNTLSVKRNLSLLQCDAH